MIIKIIKKEIKRQQLLKKLKKEINDCLFHKNNIEKDIRKMVLAILGSLKLLPLVRRYNKIRCKVFNKKITLNDITFNKKLK